VTETERRIVPYPIAWFNDLHKRGLLDLTPPYQRRSVWNDAYREYFIETVLLDYPAPPIFLHEAIDAEGLAQYSVVDGKQRITTILDFARNDFAVGEDAPIQRLQGKVFSDFDDATRTRFWRYQLPVEFLPSVDEDILKNIFDRLNRNVARLTRQELRHAKFSGEFASSAEEMTDVMTEELGKEFPHIARASRRQMRDVELVAQLLLLAEAGPATLSQDDLDRAYSDRDESWDSRTTTERRFRRTVVVMNQLAEADATLAASRLRNQADFYSLFGALLALRDQKVKLDVAAAAPALVKFVTKAGDESGRQRNADAKGYYEAARSASNDRRQRVTRIEILKNVISKAG
jgi:hypothetical protein